MVVATAPYIPLYPGTIDFLGVSTEITAANWIPVDEAIPYFHYVIVEVPTGVESGCVTIADGSWGTSGCYQFTVLE